MALPEYSQPPRSRTFDVAPNAADRIGMWSGILTVDA